MGKVIHWEMCKKIKFDPTNKWYMHNPAAVLENDTHKLLWDFDIQTDHLISARRSDLIIINNNNNNKKREFAKLWTLLSRLTTGIKLKKYEKKDKYLDLARELKKLTIIPIGAFSTVTKGLLMGLEDLEVGGRVETV